MAAVRILTFNVFFEPVAMAVRMRAIGSLIEKYRPAVVGFQEVTRESLKMLRAQRWAKYYDCSLDVAQPVSEAYFVALFSALPVKSLECKPFANSGMGRELVWMQVETAPNQTLFVGTSHLESLPQFKQTRVMQLKESLTTLQERVDEVNKESSGTTRCLGAVFMGDMNLIRGDMKLLDPSIVDGDIVVELAKTSRSKCRRCAETIEKDTLRVGRNAKDKLPNGRTVDICHWYHSKCFEGISTSTEKQILYGSSLWTGKKPAQDASSSTTSAASPDPASMGLPQGWKDLWLTVDGNTEENGYTFDGHNNGLVSSRSYRSRLDRMYFFSGDQSSDSDKPVFESIEIIGKEKITDGLWPSDHYGLLSTFRFPPAEAAAAAGVRKAPINEDQTKRQKAGSQAAPISID